MADEDSRFCPIIYVRGFAGNEAEIDEAVADPYMGFNIGSTKFRQVWTGAVRRHYFESPLYRLTKDYGYRDVYSDGVYMPKDEPVPRKSVIIYRYYDDQFLDALDDDDDDPPLWIRGERQEIEDLAAGLGKLIGKVRDRVCQDDPAAKQDFKVYLVAHSMGGLIIRSFLQHVGHGGKRVRERFGADWEKRFKAAKACVDKVFTYATPHNGIEMRVVGNVPGFFTANNVNNFDRTRMLKYLDLPAWCEDRVDNLRGRFDPQRFFTLIGTNHQDYAVAYGWSRRLVGPMSDGLVRIANAGVHSQATKNAARRHAPRAYVHRSHSGHFGIVNSEEGYQNLTRFLFGDVRVDGVLKVDEISLPAKVQEAMDADKRIRASYHFEVVVKTRGQDCDLHRRVASEGSAVFRKFDELFPKNGGKPRDPYLFSLFLSSDARKNKDLSSLAFAVELSVHVPEYEIDNRYWLDQHYKGSRILQTTIFLEGVPPVGDDDAWTVRYGVDPEEVGTTPEQADVTEKDGRYEFEIPIDSHTRPGIRGKLQFSATPWQ